MAKKLFNMAKFFPQSLGKYDVQKHLCCVFHDAVNKVAVATDAMGLLVTSRNYVDYTDKIKNVVETANHKVHGWCVDKDGNDYSANIGNYPSYTMVIPQNVHPIEIDWDDIKKQVKEQKAARAAMRKVDKYGANNITNFPIKVVNNTYLSIMMAERMLMCDNPIKCEQSNTMPMIKITGEDYIGLFMQMCYAG